MTQRITARWGLATRLAAVSLVGFAAVVISACSPGEPAEVSPPQGMTSEPRFRAPAAFDSYRYLLEIEASTDLMNLQDAPSGLNLDGEVLRIEVIGERVNPDREYSHSVSSFGRLSLERETIVIGGEFWSRQAGGPWRQRGVLARPEDLVGQDVLLSPAAIFGDDPELLSRITDDLEARPSSPDTVRGRATRYWDLDREWLNGYEDEFASVMPGFTWPDEINIHIWADVEWRVATKVIVVAVTLTNPEALRMEMELFDLNDRSISIEVPQGAIAP